MNDKDWAGLAREFADILLDNAQKHSTTTLMRKMNLQTKFCRLRTDELRAEASARTDQPELFEVKE